MARRERSFFFNNKTGALKSKGKTIIAATADNVIELRGADTGSAPGIFALGDDTNINLVLTPKGTGTVDIAEGNLNYAGTAITATGAELNTLDGITATTTELNYVDGVTSAIQTQLDAKLALAGGTMSGAIAMETNKITGMGDPTANQDAATKAYVDTQTSSIVTTTDIAGDTGTDTVTLGSDTLTFTGGQGISTTVTDNTITIATTGENPDIELDSAVGDNSTTDFSVTTAPTTAEDLLVTINGIVQRPTTDYTVSGTTVTFGTAPFTGAVVAARTITAASTGPELSADTTPQLGGNLDLNSNDITGTGNINITGNITSSGDLTVDTDTLYVDSTNNRVGIGTSSPSVDFEVDAGSATGTHLQVTTTGSGHNIDMTDSSSTARIRNANGYLRLGADHHNESAGSTLRFEVDGSEKMRIDSSGNLLVGYTSSNGAYKLQVNSQIFATSATIATSDGNYKENVTPLDGVLSLVSQLNPVQFDWKEHPVHEFDCNQPTIGFIAQEVQQVLAEQPYLNSIVKSNECVLEPEETDDEGNVIKEAVTEPFLGIAEGNMVALLIAAIKEQQATITALEARIAALENP